MIVAQVGKVSSSELMHRHEVGVLLYAHLDLQCIILADLETGATACS